MKELIKATEQMTIMIVQGNRHVVREFKRALSNQSMDFSIPRPDYLERGVALCGIIRPGSTLEEFKQEWIDRHLRFTGDSIKLEMVEKNELSESIGWKDYAHMCRQRKKLSDKGINAINLLFENKGLEKPFINQKR